MRSAQIDILVNNAAFQRSYDKFEDISDDEFEETFRVNIFAMFRLCNALLPQMKEGGSIINTGSIQSFDPSPSLIAYASTKATIVSFTRSLASLAISRCARQRSSARACLDPTYSFYVAEEEGERIWLSDCVWTRCPARGDCPYLCLSRQRPSQLRCRRGLRGHWRSNARVIHIYKLLATVIRT
jgi:hypothetical protein